jgi:hypothetical protein
MNRYNNISTKRLHHFYSKIFNIESRAFDTNKPLFLRCHYLNRQLWEIIANR